MNNQKDLFLTSLLTRGKLLKTDIAAYSVVAPVDYHSSERSMKVA